MALIKTYRVNKTGVTGTYWKLHAYEALTNNTHKITVMLYVDEQAANEEREPILPVYAIVPEPEDESHFQRNYIYQALKVLNINVEGVNVPQFFSDATDG